MTPAGRFLWYELMTTELEAALGFYAEVIGWAATPSGRPGEDYRILSMQGLAVGGALTAPQDVSPKWLPYVSVPDVEACLAAVIAAGGLVHRPAMDLPGVGRIAMLADPQGALLYVMRPEGASEATAFAMGKPGHGGWNELHARDWEAVFPLYQHLFGWEKSTPMEMGEMGTYQIFSADGAQIGAMFNNPQASPPHWLPYFNVADITAAEARLLRAGGENLMGPHPVPGDVWIIQARDPQGAAFAMVGPKP
jgi:predicted enzyme related to lactoylglutathione lyase